MRKPKIDPQSVINCGNAAKLREALKHIKDRLPHMLQYMRVHWEDASAGGYFDELMLVIDAALAAPARNCDVGTVDEQIARFDAECLAIRKRNTVEPCAGCPCSSNGEGTEDCQLRWAQMPYEPEEGGDR